jgi:hypothetical protein
MNNKLKSGARFQPIPHEELIQAIREYSPSRDLRMGEISQEKGKDGKGILIRIEMSEKGKGYLSLGITDPEDGHSKLGAYAGDQGIMLKELPYSRKHTHGFDCDEEAKMILSQFAVSFEQVGEQLKKLRARELSSEEAGQLIMRAARDGILAWYHAGKLDEAFREVNHQTAWRLLLAMNLLQRENPGKALPSRRMKREADFAQMLLAYKEMPC